MSLFPKTKSATPQTTSNVASTSSATNIPPTPEMDIYFTSERVTTKLPDPNIETQFDTMMTNAGIPKSSDYRPGVKQFLRKLAETQQTKQNTSSIDLTKNIQNSGSICVTQEIPKILALTDNTLGRHAAQLILATDEAEKKDIIVNMSKAYWGAMRNLAIFVFNIKDAWSSNFEADGRTVKPNHAARITSECKAQLETPDGGKRKTFKKKVQKKRITLRRSKMRRNMH